MQIEGQKENLVFLEQAVAGSEEERGPEEIQVLNERSMMQWYCCELS